MFLYQSEKTAIVRGDKKITHLELSKKVEYFSTLFSIQKQAHVAIYSENRLGWAYSFYAIWRNRGIPVPIDFMCTEEELTYMINDSNPEFIFVSSDKKSSFDSIKENLQYIPKVIIIDDYEDNSVDELRGDVKIEYNNEDTAVIIYTSGTTGNPKGVMLSFTNLIVNIKAVTITVEIMTKKDTVLLLLPLHHVLPLLGALIAPLSSEGTVAMSSTMAAEDLIKTLQDNKVTVIIGVPRLLAAIRKGIMDKINKSKVAKLLFKIAHKIDNMKLSKFLFKAVHNKLGGHINYIVAGGAALDTEVGSDYRTLGFKVLEGYGMTEAAPMISFTRPDKLKVGSPGHVLQGCDVKIIDGEITVKGPNVMKGYYNKPEETAEVLRDGRLYSGDLGYIDDEGFLFITGRKKEIIVLSNGKNINPVEIEGKLENYAACGEVGVYSNQDILKAIIVPSNEIIRETGSNHDDIYNEIKWKVINVYNEKCAPYKKISDFTVYYDELPKTRLGKIRRFQLNDLENAKVENNIKFEEPNDEEYAIIKKYIEDEKDVISKPTDHIEMDLAFDSLDKVGLQVFIKSSFGVDLSPEELSNFKNLKELHEYIIENNTHTKIEKINWKVILKEKVNLKLPKTWLTGTIFVKISKLFFKLYTRLKAEGLSNIPDEPCIIAPNHQSYFDGLYVASFLKHRIIKKTYFYAKEKHINKPWLKFIASKNNVIIMDLNKNLKESIQKMGEALRKNKNLIIFPEGTRTRTGDLGKFKKTFAILSRELNVPVVPVAITGAYDVMPRGSHFPKIGKKVKVNFLKPVHPDKDSSYKSIRDKVYNTIKEQLDSSSTEKNK